MARDIEQELDAIFAHHRARVAQARNEAKGVAAKDFGAAARECLAEVIEPALRQMAEALNKRGVAAKVQAEESALRIDIPVSRHARLGHGLGGYPYLRARSDLHTQRIHFERNTSDGRGGSAWATTRSRKSAPRGSGRWSWISWGTCTGLFELGHSRARARF